MKEELLKIIEEMSQEIRNAKKAPVIIIDTKFEKAIKRRILQYLRELYNEEKIDFGRTLNNNFVELRSPDSPRRNRKIILHDSPLLKDD